MTKRMLIDGAHPEETRVVIVDGNQLEDFDYESTTRQTLKGNIYLGKVTRVEPSLQACFVEYGGNRHGFLPFGEIHPDYYRIPMADREALKEAEAAAAAAAEAREDRRAAEAAAAEAARDRGETIASDEDDAPHEGDVIEEVGGHVAQHDEDEDAAPAASEATTDDAPQAEQVAPPAEEPAPQAASSVEDDASGIAPTAIENGAADQDAPEPAGGDEDDEHRRRVTRMRRNYTIQEVIKRRQIVLVQVVKEERGNKGAALTTYISLAGRYCVLMPNTTSGGGISRKITNAQDRKRLKEIVDDLDVPPGMAVILRTAGLERTKNEIKRDYEFLMKVWDEIATHTLESRAPALIHEEANLIKRTIRDSYGKDVEEVLVDGEDAYRVAKGFMRALMPSHAKKVQLYKDGPTPLFTRFGVESQLDALHATTVRLPSGGYIVINTTEALVAIDVNSGRATRERGIEETAFKTNMEAATAVARQLRLRDLAGLIVIDFIDMEDRRNNAAVERRIKEAMKADRARLQIGRISGFGLLELSRQRLRPSLFESSTHVCPHCAGTGYVRSVDSSGLHVLRAIEEEAVTGRHAEVSVHVATPIALYLLNQKRDALNRIARDHGMDVWVEADDTLLPPAHRLTGLRAKVARDADDDEPVQGVRSLPPPPVVRRSMVEDDAADEEAEQAEAAIEERAQREDRDAQEMRGRNRDGRNRDKARDSRPRDLEADETAEAGAEPERDAEPRNPSETEEESRNRRRRGRRGGRRRGRQPGDEGAERNGEQPSVQAEGAEFAPVAADDATVDAVAPTDGTAPTEGGAEDRPRRRRRRGGRNWRNETPADLAAVPEGAPPTDEPAPGGVVSDDVRSSQAMMEAAATEVSPVAIEATDAEGQDARNREATSEEAASWAITSASPATESPAAEAEAATPVTEAAPEPVPEVPAEAAIAVTEADAPAAEAAPAPDAPAPAAKRARAPRKKATPAAATATSDDAPPAEAAAKPAPRVRKPRVTKAAAAAAAAAEAEAAAAVTPADGPEATEAEPVPTAEASVPTRAAAAEPVIAAEAPIVTAAEPHPAESAPAADPTTEAAAEPAPTAEPAPEPEEPREKRRGWWNRLVS